MRHCGKTRDISVQTLKTVYLNVMSVFDTFKTMHAYIFIALQRFTQLEIQREREREREREKESIVAKK